MQDPTLTGRNAPEEQVMYIPAHIRQRIRALASDPAKSALIAVVVAAASGGAIVGHTIAKLGLCE